MTNDALAPFRLDGKVALVSGAARGIGAACAETLAAAGASVLLTDLLADAGRSAAEAIAKAGGKASFLEHDVRTEDSWSAAVARAIELYGGLDVLVNNAGVETIQPITDLAFE